MEQTQSKFLLENEDQIVEKAKTDDRSFEVLYNHYFPKVYGFVMKRVGQKELTEDLVSTTFVKVFTNIKKYEKKHNVPFGAWLFRIATNNVIDFYRQRGKRITVDIEAIVEPRDPQKGPSDIVSTDQDKELVRRVVAEMPERYQRILNLKFFAEFSYEEIAVTLELTVNNCRVMVHRALKAFEKYYQKYVK